MYSGTRSLKLNFGIIQLTPGAALFLALAGVIVLVFFAGQQAVRLASRDIVPGMSRGVSRQIRESENDGAHAIPISAVAAAHPTAQVSVPALVSAPPPALPPVIPLSALAPFPNPSDQSLAKEALEPVRQLLAEVRKQDSDLFPASTDLTATQLVGSVQNGTNNQKTIEQAKRVPLITAALGSETALVLHPDRFPEPLRDGAGEISREIHAYLANADLAAGQPAPIRAALQASCSARLARAEKVFSGLEAIAAGGEDIGSGGIPLD